MKKHFALFIIVGLLYSCSNSETSTQKQPTTKDTILTYRWATGLCDYQGNYNPQKISENQLKNTYDLCFTFSGISLETDGTANNPEDIKKLSIPTLTQEYKKKRAYYIAMEIVDLPYWQNLRMLRIQELDDEFYLKKITIESYNNPSILKTSRYAKTCPDVIDALNSKDEQTLLNFWKRFVTKYHKEHQLPQSYIDKFNKENASEQKLIYAKIELINYGWWNAANEQLRRVEQTEEMSKSFEKLFTNIKVECEEP